MTTPVKTTLAAARRCAARLNPNHLWQSLTRCDHPRTHREFVAREAVHDSRGDYALVTEIDVCNVCGGHVGDSYTVIAH